MLPLSSLTYIEAMLTCHFLLLRKIDPSLKVRCYSEDIAKFESHHILTFLHHPVLSVILNERYIEVRQSL